MKIDNATCRGAWIAACNDWGVSGDVEPVFVSGSCVASYRAFVRFGLSGRSHVAVAGSAIEAVGRLLDRLYESEHEASQALDLEFQDQMMGVDSTSV